MHILVTGGAGYIGSVTVEKLVQQHDVVVLDDLSTGYKKLINPKCQFIKGSILNREVLNQLFAKHRFDLVIHVAAKTVVPESTKKPKLYLSTNYLATKYILETMKKYGCNKIIFSSSAATYGEPRSIPIKENSLQKPINPYGKSKLLAEKEIIKSHNAYAILRFFNVAGASDSLKYGMMKTIPTLLIPCINKMIAHKKLPIIYGNKYSTKDGTCLRDYVHVEDLAVAILKCIKLLQTNKSCILNLGSGSGNTVLEVVKQACKANHVPIKYEIKPNRPGDPAKLVTTNNEAKKIINWKPTYSLKQMIDSDCQFRKKHKLDHE